MPLLDKPSLVFYHDETIVVTEATILNLDTSFQFSTDASDYLSPPTVTIGSCATAPSNTMCATPPPPSSPTSTQQIPPLPLANFYGEASGQTFLAQAISSACAAVGTSGTIAASVIFDILTAVEELLLW